MIKIVPSILSADFGRLGEEVSAVDTAGADWIHVDVMDGHFVPNLTYGPDIVATVRRFTKLPNDAHLMIDNPDDFIEKFARARATHISVHAEASRHLNRSLALARSCGACPRVAIGPAAPLELLDWCLDYVDYVLDKVRTLRERASRRGLSPVIQSDGGINERTIAGFSREGADAAVFELASGAKTREMYPFEFVLRVRFALERAGIAVRYDVVNRSAGRIWFSIGSHPAFTLPFAGGFLENYYVVFQQEERLERWFFKDGMVVAGKTAEALENARVLSLSRTLFDQGPVIFKAPASREFTIANSKNSHAITVAMDGVPYVAVWSKPNGAPFLCIEPWHGLPGGDPVGARRGGRRERRGAAPAARAPRGCVPSDRGGTALPPVPTRTRGSRPLP
jgi:ribulose-phosphate 3-epimerase